MYGLTQIKTRILLDFLINGVVRASFLFFFSNFSSEYEVLPYVEEKGGPRGDDFAGPPVAVGEIRRYNQVSFLPFTHVQQTLNVSYLMM